MFEGLRESGEADDSRWRAILRMRELLKEYSMSEARVAMGGISWLIKSQDEATLSGSKTAQLQMPSKEESEHMQKWMMDDGNGTHTEIVSCDRRIWQDTPLADMVALCAREYSDPISNWIYEKALGWYHQRIRYRFAKVRECHR